VFRQQLYPFSPKRG